MKIRLDQYLCQNGLAQSRERAKALIMAGIVYVGEEKSDKPGNMVDENAHVEVRGHDIRYVSRGGLKLEKAMQVFPLTPEGKVCMDIGASTGGFTDCMLQNGVREAATHREVIEAASGFAVQNGFSAVGLDFSPIKGPEGNIEFLMHVRKCVQPEGLPQRTIEAVVSKAHESL